MTAEQLLLQAFHAVYCNTALGEVPLCAGCEWNIRGKGCTHDQNPYQIMYREMERKVKEVSV